MKIAVVAAFIASLPGIALAQNSPGFSSGQILTAGQLNSAFQGKLDNSAQAVLVALGGTPLTTNPNTAAAVPCQGTNGSVISTVTTTPSIVCNAATSRTFASVVANSGAFGTQVAVGTYDGSTPSSTHFNFVLYGAGSGSWDTSGYATVPPGAIQIMSLSGTVTITATAAQSPAP